MAIKREAPARPKREPELAAVGFVMNAQTGAVLLDKGADDSRDPASLTKLGTAYMVMRAVKAGTVKLDDKIKISAGAAQLDNNTLAIPVTNEDGSKDTLTTLPEGTQMTVREALVVMISSSANGVAKALGEHLAPDKLNARGKTVRGTERDFAREMTAVLRDELGLANSSFINASGLNNGGAEQKTNLSTARDMGKLAVGLMQNFPEYEKLLGTHTATTRLALPDGRKLAVHSPTTNHFLRDFAEGSKRADKEGFAAVGPQKTGYNKLSGGINLLSTAQNEAGVRLVSVVLGGNGSDNRYAANLKNLRSGFAMTADNPQFAAVYQGGAERAALVAAVSPSAAFAETATRSRSKPAPTATQIAQAPRQSPSPVMRVHFNNPASRVRSNGVAAEQRSAVPVTYRYMPEPTPEVRADNAAAEQASVAAPPIVGVEALRHAISAHFGTETPPPVPVRRPSAGLKPDEPS